MNMAPKQFIQPQAINPTFPTQSSQMPNLMPMTANTAPGFQHNLGQPGMPPGPQPPQNQTMPQVSMPNPAPQTAQYGAQPSYPNVSAAQPISGTSSPFQPVVPTQSGHPSVAPGFSNVPTSGAPNMGPSMGPPRPPNMTPTSNFSGMPAPHGMQPPGPPGMMASSGAPSMPGMAPPGMPGMAQPGMPGMPGMGPPGMPGMAPPGMPGMAQPGMPGMGPPGMAQPGMPGMGPPGMTQPGMPGMGPPGMPGMAPPGMPGAAAPYPGAPGAGAYPGGMPQQPQQKLNAKLMPSAVQVREEDAVRAGLFPTGFPHAEHPPLVTTEFYAQDQGNVNPRFMRSTMYVAPQSGDILKHSQLPLAVAISPFAALDERERPPPVVDLGPQGPIRCQRCKAYMCPFMEFQDGGRRFRCPYCHATTPVEDAYFAHLDHTGRRTDIEYRPELLCGAYEFVATKQYCKNGIAPKEPAFIFMIDVSYNSVTSGMLQVLCKNLEATLMRLPKEHSQQSSSIRVGIATFDQAIHFFDLSSNTPNMMVVGDISEVFVPCVDGLLVPFEEGFHAIRAVLEEIPKLYAHTRVTEGILGPAVQAGLDALKCADRAGKIFIFSTSLPTLEAPGKLKNRDDRKLLGTEKEKAVLLPQCEFYTKLGEQCVKGGCTVDVFLFPNSYIDVATIGQLTAVTGGSLYKYQYFDAQKDSQRFLSDLSHDVSRQIAFDCMVRVRSSAGIRPVKFYGSFFMENTTDMEIASIDQDKAFFVELKHDDKLSDPLAVIQAAVLYTSVSGQRRLRILNMCLPVTTDYNHIFRVADQDVLATYLFKNGVEINREKGQKEVREQLTNRVAKILAAYREKCSSEAALGQLILPETLKVLPCLVNSILKHDAIAAGSEMTVDDKAWLIEAVRGMKVEDAVQLLYPRMVAVSQLVIDDPAEIVTLPPQVRASIEFMENDKAYVIDTGICLFIWIGLGVAAEWVQEVFGAQAVTMIDTENHVIPEKDNTRSRALRRIIELVNKGSSRSRKLFIIREKDALEGWMKKFLVEDKPGGSSGMSYVDYLCLVHREIRNLLS
ncbi:unnamed protein product, partial [Mesorhabditis belari]|uniref:Uncharacterized protein n=1 Tax=Mesorhabditis belari TaxID=2138241 RepID=A0AAF3FEV4_9BILA